MSDRSAFSHPRKLSVEASIHYLSLLSTLSLFVSFCLIEITLSHYFFISQALFLSFWKAFKNPDNCVTTGLLSGIEWTSSRTIIPKTLKSPAL